VGTDIKPTYSGEVQFAGYSDSSRSGPRITLRLAERADLEAFVGSEGKRYMLALVEIGADEQPVQAPQKAAGPLCKWVAIRCKEPEFWDWITSTETAPVSDGPFDEWAAWWVRKTCGVNSRSEIDGNPEAEKRFHTLIRQPYADWLAVRGTR
jgi:hypothetical protein